MVALAPAAPRVVDDRARAAGKDPAVDAAVVEGRPAQPLAEAGEAAGRADRMVVDAKLVIADQSDAPRGQRKAGHAVELAGREIAVVHRLALRRNDRIAKAGGQIEIARGVRDQGPVARNFAAIGRDSPGRLREAAPGEAQECEGHGAAAELPSVDHG